jgi:hypothetical protein
MRRRFSSTRFGRHTDEQSFNYTPGRDRDPMCGLANGSDPTAITNDTRMLFKRSTTGSMTGYYSDTSRTTFITTTVSNKQVQFVEGSSMIKYHSSRCSPAARSTTARSGLASDRA